jgi:hypothetical protein
MAPVQTSANALSMFGNATPGYIRGEILEGFSTVKQRPQVAVSVLPGREKAFTTAPIRNGGPAWRARRR